MSDERPPWVNADGSTNVERWLMAYGRDSNTYWRTEPGHVQNVLDAVLDQRDDLLRLVGDMAHELVELRGE